MGFHTLYSPIAQSNSLSKRMLEVSARCMRSLSEKRSEVMTMRGNPRPSVGSSTKAYPRHLPPPITSHFNRRVCSLSPIACGLCSKNIKQLGRSNDTPTLLATPSCLTVFHPTSANMAARRFPLGYHLRLHPPSKQLKRCLRSVLHECSLSTHKAIRGSAQHSCSEW